MFTGLVLLCMVGTTNISNDYCIVQHSPVIYQTQLECATETFLLKEKGFFELELKTTNGSLIKYTLRDFICFNWANKKI